MKTLILGSLCRNTKYVGKKKKQKQAETEYWILLYKDFHRTKKTSHFFTECKLFQSRVILYCNWLTHISFFFFYGGSLMDVASQTAWRNSPLSSACLTAFTVETPIHSQLSCVHLLLGLPLPLLPSHMSSKNSFSNVLCRLMWPKYDSFCFLIRFKSCGAFTPSCSRTLAFVFLSVHEILSIFRWHFISKEVIFFSSVFEMVQASQP